MRHVISMRKLKVENVGRKWLDWRTSHGLWCDADIELNMKNVPTVSKHEESESPFLPNYFFRERKNDGKAAVPLGRTTPGASLAMHEANHFHWKVEVKSVATNGWFEEPVMGHGALSTCTPFSTFWKG